jgi:predicted nucleic acid-binding Zn ribbon protein
VKIDTETDMLDKSMWTRGRASCQEPTGGLLRVLARFTIACSGSGTYVGVRRRPEFGVRASALSQRIWIHVSSHIVTHDTCDEACITINH